MSAPTLSRPSRLDPLRSYSTVLGMIVVVVLVAVARPLFVDPRNLAAVAVDATVLVVLAVGLSVLMSMKGLDLSIAATADLAGYLAARALLDGQGTRRRCWSRWPSGWRSASSTVSSPGTSAFPPSSRRSG